METPPEGYLFTDVILKQLFAEVWTQKKTSMRDKRILLLGIIAEKGQAETFQIQAKASLKNGEITPDELRELHLLMAQYRGYPNAAAMVAPLETAIAEFEQETKKS